MVLDTENFLLLGSILLFVSVLVSRAGSRFGMPALVLFLGVGMMFGSDGVGIQMSNPQSAQFIGMVALSIILFSGGMDTQLSSVRPVWGAGVTLATAGVILTTIFAGVCIFGLSRISNTLDNLTPMECLLLAAVMSSTDSASVFSILRSKKKHLKYNLRPLLELESGSNDPMAYMLTILLIEAIMGGHGLNGWHLLWMLLQQMTLGALAGALMGWAAVQLMNRIHLENHSLYSMLLLASCFFIFAITDLVGGNGYLAVYLAGLVIGNSRMSYKRLMTHFFDGFTWLFQIAMFVTLGLLVKPSELPEVLGIGALIAVGIIFVARPVAVWVSLLPFGRRFSTRARNYVSWVGLRGAVPIIFAIYPVVEGVPHASMFFNIVFCITLISLLVQGTTLGWLAERLNLSRDPREHAFERIDLPENIRSALSEIEVAPRLLEVGDTLADLQLPASTLVVMVEQEGNYFVPSATTRLHVGDKLLVISDNDEALRAAYCDLGIMRPLKGD